MEIDSFAEVVNDDLEIPFEEVIQTESLIKERTLRRIRQANRDRSFSNLAASVHSQESDDDSIEGDYPSSITAAVVTNGIGIADIEKSSQVSDVRKELFEAIPEPYYQSTEFRRVVVTELSDATHDDDSKEACKLLDRCMKMREKYISEHPFPPQDIPTSFYENSGNSDGATPMSPKPKLTHNQAIDPNIEFRRRQVPPYEIFSVPLPETSKDLVFKMVNGVMSVKQLKSPIRRARAKSLSMETREKDGSDPTFYLSVSKDENDAKVEDVGIEINSPSREVNSEEEDSLLLKSREQQLESIDWKSSMYSVLTFEEFIRDFQFVKKTVFSGPVSSYCYQRLEFLMAKFNLHCLLNESLELEAQKSVPHRDFYNVRKVDTHVHHSACMNQKHLLRFIKHKLRHHPNEAVIFRDGRFLTLGEVFKSLNLTAYDLSIDTLDMHANNTFHRFDKFNLKYNPAGQSRLREIFLKTDNVIGGRYLAEITQEVMNDLSASKYQLVEWRISIYGRKASEWSSLARWFYIHKLAHPNVRWLIQIPRLYDIYRKSGEVHSFGQMLSNIFTPLFAVSIDPSSNPPLHYLLQTVVGIDSVDDESRPEHDQLNFNCPVPELWDMPYNPPYGYWMYYMHANICILNKLRASKGLSTFQFRPHCGEAGDVDHLISTYLVGHQINHGILLRKNPALQYLYYLSQIGIAMSPLSNNKLFLNYNKNPFIKYFKIGMNVSLSTDDPLMLHITKDPLLEEYSVAAQVWKLSSTDQCEIARNSVLQSGWERKFKFHFLGKDYSDIRETNVPVIRLLYRNETLDAEIAEIKRHVK